MRHRFFLDVEMFFNLALLWGSYHTFVLHQLCLGMPVRGELRTVHRSASLLITMIDIRKPISLISTINCSTAGPNVTLPGGFFRNVLLAFLAPALSTSLLSLSFHCTQLDLHSFHKENLDCFVQVFLRKHRCKGSICQRFYY